MLERINLICDKYAVCCVGGSKMGVSDADTSGSHLIATESDNDTPRNKYIIEVLRLQKTVMSNGLR